MKNERQIPACVTVRGFRVNSTGVFPVAHLADANVARIDMDGLPAGLQIDISGSEGSGRFWWIMRAISEAYALGSDNGFQNGRRDVIDKVGKVFANPRVPSSGRGA
ncbi:MULTISPECIES: hypothetical protein [unclassified Bradyrhizobium]|uniref:hypothetical protein n=1 Tax=unclassified Bradyrhizobium TaxID=2631580 RepID=UPI0028E25504|nr:MULTISPECIES: hypothetical protein [unclassified Bradyrhizobium]